MTLIELLCVIAILAVLASLLLPAVARAYSRSRARVEEWEAPAVAELLVSQTRTYCSSQSKFQFDSRSDFLNKCPLSSKCRGWVKRSSTEFIPFDYQSPTNLVVLTVHVGRNEAIVYTFSMGQLSVAPQ